MLVVLVEQAATWEIGGMKRLDIVGLYANTGLACALVVCGVILYFALSRVGIMGSSMIVPVFYIGLPATVAVYLLGCFFLPRSWRVLTVNCGLAATVALSAAQVYVLAGLEDTKSRIAAVEEVTGIPFDRRSLFQLMADLEAEGQPALPAILPERTLRLDEYTGLRHPILKAEGEPVLPFGMISRQKLIACNEFGKWLVISTDEHGFRNPPGYWSTDSLDIMAIGDSFTFGSCVEDDQTITAHLSKSYATVLNLGASGAGPLFVYAYLKEFGLVLQPKVVLWLFFEGNDMQNLRKEEMTPLLLRYINEPDYRQNLLERQDAIDRELVELTRNLLAGSTEAFKGATRNREKSWRRRLLDFVLLRPLRIELQFKAFDRYRDRSLERLDFGRLREIMKRSRDLTASWGGRLYMVYLPSWLRHRDERGLATREFVDLAYEKLTTFAEDLEIPLIDVLEVFKRSPDPHALVPYPGMHYNAIGYELAARTIADQLADDR